MANIKKTKKRGGGAGKDAEQLRLYTKLGVSLGKSNLENRFTVSATTICRSSKLATTQMLVSRRMDTSV